MSSLGGTLWFMQDIDYCLGIEIWRIVMAEHISRMKEKKCMQEFTELSWNLATS
jgi:hypothetical protein